MQSLPQATKLDRSRQACAGALLGVLPGLMRFVRHHMRSRRASGLSIPQFRTLVQLYHQPSASLSAIAEALGATAPATSRMVSGLVRKGFVVRKDSSRDRRQVVLALSPRGRAAMKSAWSGTQQSLADRLEGLSGPQLQELTRSLVLLSSLLDPQGKPPEPVRPRTSFVLTPRSSHSSR